MSSFARQIDLLQRQCQALQAHGGLPADEDALRQFTAALDAVQAAGAELEKQAEESAREAQFANSLLHALMDALPVGVVVCEADGTVQMTNATGEAILGSRVSGSVYQPERSYTIHCLDGSPFPSEELPLRQALERGATTGNVEILVRWADGAEHTILSAAAPVCDAAGQVDSAVVIFQDITAYQSARQEREQLLKNLDAERARLKAVIDHAPEAIVVVDEAGRIVLANPAVDRLYARPIPGGQDLASSADLALCYPDGTPYDPRDLPLTRSVQDGEPFSDLEMTIRWPDGQLRDLRISTAPIRDDQGQSHGAVGVFQDFTERKRTRALLQQYTDRHAAQLEALVAERTAELRASEAQFRAIFEEAAMGIALLDAQGRVVESNPALQTMLGYVADELRGVVLAALTHPDDVGDEESLYQELMAGQRDDYSLEKRYVHQDGQTLWAELVVSPVRRIEGETGYAISMVEDVTARREAQEALIQAEKLAITGKLAASLAHEINNPLQSVIGCLGLAEEALDAGRDMRRYLQVAIEELERAARIVTQLRDLQRWPNRGERAPTDVNALVERVLTLNQRRCANRGIAVVWEPAVDLPPLHLAEDRIHQAFLNLVLNAVEAMPEGGELRVKSSYSPAPAEVWVTVADTGIGIDPDALPHLFEPFHSTKPDGMGLGLYVSHDIVTRHGGRLDVESTPGQGTTFTVRLPA